MAFNPPFAVGTVVSNAVMAEAFKVGNMGGMRRSKTTGTLVLISDNTKGLYSDKWNEGILHYTGMGKIGDQALDKTQNKTLAESQENGVEVHLFEVDEPGKYTYEGVVELAGKPYQETQPDDNGNPRKVWMFPLKKKIAVGVTQDAKKDESTKTVHEMEEENYVDQGTVKEESIVYHKEHGEGTVKKITEKNVYVVFGSKTLIFPNPEAFEKKYLIPAGSIQYSSEKTETNISADKNSISNEKKLDGANEPLIGDYWFERTREVLKGIVKTADHIKSHIRFRCYDTRGTDRLEVWLNPPTKQEAEFLSVWIRDGLIPLHKVRSDIGIRKDFNRGNFLECEVRFYISKPSNKEREMEEAFDYIRELRQLAER